MSSDTQLQPLIDDLVANRLGATDRLLEHSSQRLRKLTRKLLRGSPALRRWEETDDVLQNALMRLVRSLKDVKPENPRAYFGLAAIQIRRELIDLARKHYGPHGDAAHHVTDPGFRDADGRIAPLYEDDNGTAGPATLMQWAEFHEHVEKLPDDERATFELLFYQGLSQEEAAAVLEVSERTIKRRWREAKLLLGEAMEGGPKGL